MKTDTKVLRRMERNPSSLFLSEVAQGAGISREQARESLRRLEDAGRVESSWRLRRKKETSR